MTQPNRTVSAVDDADFLPQDELAILQAKRWREQAAYVVRASAFFADLYGHKDIDLRIAAFRFQDYGPYAGNRV